MNEYDVTSVTSGTGTTSWFTTKNELLCDRFSSEKEAWDHLFNLFMLEELKLEELPKHKREEFLGEQRFIYEEGRDK